MTITEFLTWLALSGGSAAAVSWIAEQIPQFQQLTVAAKKWIMFIASALVSVGAYAALTYVPVDILAAIAPYFAIVAGLFVTFFLNQVAHLVDPNKK